MKIGAVLRQKEGISWWNWRSTPAEMFVERLHGKRVVEKFHGAYSVRANLA